MTPKTLDKYIAALKKKAAAESWTTEQYIAELNKIHGEMSVQYLDNKITDAEYAKVVKQIANAKKKQALQGGTKPAVQTGPNPGTQAADDAAAKLEKKLKKVYKQAADEVQKQLDELISQYGPKMKALELDFINGTISQQDLKWLQAKNLQKKILNQKMDQLTGTMLEANKKAMGMINGEQVNVFAENANYQAYQLSQEANLNLMFSVYDEDTAERLLKEEPELLPRKEVNGKKDKAWNQKVISNAVLQAVIQGESIPKLAKRIAVQTGETNMKAMVRYARTAMTGAQNAGRINMLHRAQGMGIKVKKVWMATLDSRTRDSHQHLDGEKAEVDEKFGNGLMYPGDPNGPPGEVYNCRCTLVYDYEGFPHDPTADQRLQYDEWDDVWYTTEKDKNGKEYQKEHRKHHRKSRLIQFMTYDEWKTAKQGSALNELNMAKYLLGDAQKAVIKAKVKEDKVYSGLWKDDVTLADYAAKKAGIPAKRDYYNQEIQKYKDAQANGASWATDEKIKELEKKRKQLNEFEKFGELVEKRNEALKKVQQIYDKVGYQSAAEAPAVAQNKAKKKASASAGANTKAAASAQNQAAPAAKTGQFAADAWDEKTKKAATDYRTRETADKSIRPNLDAVWDQLSDYEKYAVWEYTHNSHPLNRPLTGYNDTWEDRGWIGGPDKTIWGYEDNYSNRNLRYNGDMAKFGDKNGQPSFKKAITALTTAIEKTPLQEGIYLHRGSNTNAFAGLFRSAGMDYDTVKKLLDRGSIAEIKKALVGQKAINHAFTSTGIAQDSGFGGEVKYRIYAPKGTKGVYAEPQSHYGLSMGGDDKIYKKGSKHSRVGREAEIILQRGTTFVVKDIKKDANGNIVVEMDVVEQPDYFQYGDEDTFNGGKTRHKR